MDERERLTSEQYVHWDLENLKVLEIHYSETLNPLFIWEAITVLERLRNLYQDGVKVPDLPSIPEWGMSYINRAALKITEVANTKPPTEAVKQVPDILGFKVGRGASIFKRYLMLRRAVEIQIHSERSRRAGKSGAHADKVIRQKYGEKDPTVISKQKTFGKRIQERTFVWVDKATTE